MYEVTSPTNSGRVIAVWSPISRQGGVSATAALIAAYLSKTRPDERILIVSNDTRGNPTADYYLTKEHGINGLAEVIELSISDNLKNPEDLYNNAHSLVRNLDTLTCDKGNTNVADFLSREINSIIKVARRGYRYIIIDTVSGLYDSTTTEVLKSADCIVAGIPQDRYVFDSWVRKMPEIYPQFIHNNKKIINVAAIYFDYAHMNYNNMRRELKGIDLFYINQNSAVHKACYSRNMLDFVSGEMKAKKNRDEVIDEIGVIVDRIDNIINEIIENEIKQEEKAAEENLESNKRHLEESDRMYSDQVFESPDEDNLSDIEDSFGEFEEYSDAQSAEQYDGYSQPAQDGYEQPVYDEQGYAQEGYTQDSYAQDGYTQPVQDGYDQSAQDGYTQPVYDQQAYQQGGYGQPGYEQPGYDAQEYQQPGYEQTQDGYEQPGYEQSAYGTQEYQQDGYIQEGYEEQPSDSGMEPQPAEDVPDEYKVNVVTTNKINLNKADLDDQSSLLDENYEDAGT